MSRAPHKLATSSGRARGARARAYGRARGPSVGPRACAEAQAQADGTHASGRTVIYRLLGNLPFPSTFCSSSSSSSEASGLRLKCSQGECSLLHSLIERAGANCSRKQWNKCSLSSKCASPCARNAARTTRRSYTRAARPAELVPRLRVNNSSANIFPIYRAACQHANKYGRAHKHTRGGSQTLEAFARPKTVGH